MKRLVILGLTGTAFLAVGCGSESTAQPTASGAGVQVTPTAVTIAKPTSKPAPAVAKYPAACTAILLGKADNWAAAETHWLSAENASSSDGSATLAFFQLVADSGSLALDTLGGKSSTSDMATYKTDLAVAGGYLAGC
jgi:hypothetical protein